VGPGSRTVARGRSLEFSTLVLERALVAVSPGIGFGQLGEGLVRFAPVENDHRLKQATASTKKFMRGE
jgi:alanine-synthesizing transaminase